MGWRALALSLIASEVTDGERDANLHFLHDPANFNFVTTAQGKLGNLLRHGRCHIIEPVVVDYVSKPNAKPTEKGDLWRVLLLVNCRFQAPIILPTTASSLSRRARDKIGSRNLSSLSESRLILQAPGSIG
ncbi:hypothetical protein ACQPTN_05560 [Bradyrhizobium sp. 13971]